MVVVLPEAVFDRLCRQPVGHECLHDSEESQSDARQLAQGEGDETLGGDLEVVSLVQYIAAACCSLLLDLGSVTGSLRGRVRCKYDEDLEHDPAPSHHPTPPPHLRDTHEGGWLRVRRWAWPASCWWSATPPPLG